MPLIPEPGPLRLMAIASLVNTFGNGLFYTSAALFYTRSIGLSPREVGLGLTVAGLVALFVGVPAGHLADLRGAREILVVLLFVEAAAMVCFVFVDGFVSFLLVSLAYVCVDKANSAVRQGLVATALPAEGRVAGRAYLRSVTNLGIGAGSLVAGIAIAIGTREAYVGMVVGNAITYVLCAFVIARLPRREGIKKAVEGGMLIAIKDWPYVVVTILGAVANIHYVVLEIAVPLWVDRYTDAPTWTVALLFLINTSACVLLQVRASKTSYDVRSSAISVRNGSLLVGLACLVFATSEHRGAAVAIAILVLATLIDVGGELLQAGGSWGLGFGLAPEHAQGQYQGLYSTGFAAANMLGPLVVTSTAIQYGVAGWVFLAALFVAAGLATVPAAAWAERSRVVAAHQ